MQLLHNTSLHFVSLLPSDAGFYQCETSFEFSAWDICSTVNIHEVEHSSRNKGRRVHTYRTFSSFLVDPWNVSISGPDTVFPGRLSKFTCLTSCTLNVDCTVRWLFRTGFPIGTYLSVHENELKWTPSIPGTFQNFTCVAENAAAGRSAEATKTVEVKGTDPSCEFARVCFITSLSHFMLSQAALFILSSLPLYRCSCLWIRGSEAQWTSCSDPQPGTADAL